MRPSGSFGRLLGRSLLLLLLGTVNLTPVHAGGDAPALHQTYFKEPLSKLLYFKNRTSLLGIDKSGGRIFHSTDSGAHWNVVSAIPSGKAVRLYAHPHEPRIAYVLSDSSEHWITRDEGKSWEAFSSPLPATSSGERPLSFHAERSGWVLFIGEKCVEESGGWWPFPRLVCHDEAYFVKDGFAKAAKDHKAGDHTGSGITPLLGEGKAVAKCMWARHTKEFETMAEEAIFCLEIVPASASESTETSALRHLPADGPLPRVHRRNIVYPHASSQAHPGDGIQLSAAEGPLLATRGLKDAVAGILEGQIARNKVQLLVSEDFFATKRIVHFGSGNDGTGGDRAGGGVVAFSVVKSYLLAAISHADSNEMDLFISVNGHTWAESHLPLPPGTEEDAYTILESTQHSVLVDILTSKTRAVGSLFRSNSNGTYYTQSLEHTHRSKDGLVDVERVHGVEGVIIANQVSNWDQVGKGSIFHRERIELRSRISFDDGAHWRYLRAPEKDIDGKALGCSADGWHTGECALHLHSVTSTRAPGRIFGSASSAGVVLAVGSVGSKMLGWRECDTFLSRDAGVSWSMVHRDAHHVQIADSGAVLVLANDEAPTDSVTYSLDSGRTWAQAALPGKVRVTALFIDDDGLSPVVLAVGTAREGDHNHEQVIVALDFSHSYKAKCGVDPSDPKPSRDMEEFALRSDDKGNDCVMGHQSRYVRRKPDAPCHLSLDRVLVPRRTDCKCSKDDFECDYNYALNKDDKCELVGTVVVPRGQCLNKDDHFMASSGYRHIPGNTCLRDSGLVLDKPVDTPCPRAQKPGGGNHDNDKDDGGSYRHGHVSHHTTVVRGDPHIMTFPNSTAYLLMTSEQELYRTDDEGAKWAKIDLAKSTGKSDIGKPVYLAEHHYDNSRAFVYTEKDVLAYTKDRGVSWHILKNLPTPANGLHIRPIIDFNPTNPDWLLFVGGTACPNCHSEIWVSRDNGDKWSRLTTHATKCQFAHSTEAFDRLPPQSIVCTNYRLTSGADNEQDRQAHKKSAGNYVEIRVFTNPFVDSSYQLVPLPTPELSEIIALHVYSRFIVAAVVENRPDDTGRTEAVLKMYVSEDGTSAHEARFPPGVNIKPEGFTLLPSHAGTILIDVEGAPNTGDKEWSTGWGTLFASNSNGTHFHLVLEHTNRNHHGMVDIERVHGLNGMLMANRVLNAEALGKPGVHKRLRTVASWDDGRSWHPLAAPKYDRKGKTVDCVDCTLNLYSRSSMISRSPHYGVDSAPGYLMGVGSVGTHLDRITKSKTFMSRDGGITWAEVHGTEAQYEFGDHGALLVLVDDLGPTDTLHYSYDAGHTWFSYKFVSGGSRVIVERITNGLTGGGQHMLIQAREVRPAGGPNFEESMVISVDFSHIHSRQCQIHTGDHSRSDFELWTPRWGMDSSGKDAAICVLGSETSYWRRKPRADCFVGKEFDPPEIKVQPCQCTIQDYECEEGFWLNDYGECALDGPDPYQPADCREGSTYSGRSGYTKIALSQCSGGKRLEEPVPRVCGRAGGLHSYAHVFDSAIAEMQYFKNSHHVVARTENDHVFVSYDEGGRWARLEPPNVKDQKAPAPEKLVAIVRQPYFDDYAYFLPARGSVALYTDDAGRSTRLLHLPMSPAHLYQAPLRFHPDYSEWIIFLGQKREDCRTMDAGECRVEAFVTRDHGAHWHTLVSPLGAGGCSFLRTDRLTKSHRSSVVCARHPGARNDGGSVLVSDDWFTRKQHALIKNATDYAIMGEFLIVSQDANDGKALTMHVSLDGLSAAVAKFPGNKKTMDPAYTVLEPPEGFSYRDEAGNNQKMPGGGLMMHVTKSQHAGAEWGSIYSSNSNGTYYRQTLEYVNRDENGLVDFERIRALEGVAIANTVANAQAVLKQSKSKQLQTQITIDGGSRWHYLRVDGSTPCHQTAPKSGDCALHLHGYTEVSDPENIYSASGAVGLLMGVGNVGPSLRRIGEADTYLSVDGGATWKLVRKGPKWHEFGDHGALIVVADRLHPSTEVEYSLDQGKTWQSMKLPKEAHSMRIEFLTTTPDSTSRRFALYGRQGDRGIIVGLDFTGAQPRICKFDPLDEKKHANSDDFELFSPLAIDSREKDECILGRKVQYYRRIADRQCYVGDEFRAVRYISSPCECTERDFECNYNFIRENPDAEESQGRCVLVQGMQAPRTNCTVGHKDYFVIESAYRKIPQSICRNGLALDKPREVWCPGKARTVAILWALALPIVFLGLAYVGYQTWRQRYPYLRLEDIGTAMGPAIRRNLGGQDLRNAGILRRLAPVFDGALATAMAAGHATKEGFLWGLDRAAPYLPQAVQRWSYEHPPRWGAQLSMDGRSRHAIRSGGGSRFAYRPVGTNEAASQVFGSYDGDRASQDEYDEFEAGFNHFLEEEEFNSQLDIGEGDARPVDRQVLFANSELSDEEDELVGE
ncbi:vacuolar protein sorting/targeting protein PEP1 [Coemansia sp. S155-1]|nr:vacuolar protein sorting/targeting protein PEP1 [Coemansia sp. S3946]KAJ2075708.1 vacuolar protein sorting/targeting protein PEP1 [Coemansia sp. S155-1]